MLLEKGFYYRRSRWSGSSLYSWRQVNLSLTGCAKLCALFQIELFYPDFDKYSIINEIVRLIERYSRTDIWLLEHKNAIKLSNLLESSIGPLSCSYSFGWTTTDFPIGLLYCIPWVSDVFRLIFSAWGIDKTQHIWICRKNDFVHTAYGKMLKSIRLSLGFGFSGKNWQLFNSSFQTQHLLWRRKVHKNAIIKK